MSFPNFGDDRTFASHQAVGYAKITVPDDDNDNDDNLRSSDLQRDSLKFGSADPTSLFGSPTTVHTETDADIDGYNNDLPSLAGAPEYSNYHQQHTNSQLSKYDEYQSLPSFMPSQRSHVGMNHSLNYSLNYSLNHNQNGKNSINSTNRETKSMILGSTYSSYNNRFHNKNKRVNSTKPRKSPNYTLTNFTLPAHLQIIPNFYNNTINTNSNTSIVLNSNHNNNNNEVNQQAMSLNPNYFRHKHSTSGGSAEEHENNSFLHKSQPLLLSGTIENGSMNNTNIKTNNISNISNNPNHTHPNRNRINSHSHSRSHSHSQQSLKSPMLGPAIMPTNRKPIFIGGTAGSKPSSQHRHHHIHKLHDKQDTAASSHGNSNNSNNNNNHNGNHRLSETNVLNHNKQNMMNRIESRMTEGLMSCAAFKSFFPNIEQYKIVKYGWLRKQGQFRKSWKRRYCLLLCKRVETFTNKNKGKTTEDYDWDYKYYAKKNDVLELNKNRAKDRKIYYSFRLLYFKDNTFGKLKGNVSFNSYSNLGCVLPNEKQTIINYKKNSKNKNKNKNRNDRNNGNNGKNENNGNTRARSSHKDKKKDLSKDFPSKYGFYIQSLKRVWLFDTETKRNADKWMDCIQNCQVSIKNQRLKFYC